MSVISTSPRVCILRRLPSRTPTHGNSCSIGKHVQVTTFVFVFCPLGCPDTRTLSGLLWKTRTWRARATSSTSGTWTVIARSYSRSTRTACCCGSGGAEHLSISVQPIGRPHIDTSCRAARNNCPFKLFLPNDAVCKYPDPGTLLRLHALPGNSAAPVTLPSIDCHASNTQLRGRRIGVKGETSVVFRL